MHAFNRMLGEDVEKVDYVATFSEAMLDHHIAPATGDLGHEDFFNPVSQLDGFHTSPPRDNMSSFESDLSFERSAPRLFLKFFFFCPKYIYSPSNLCLAFFKSSYVCPMAHVLTNVSVPRCPNLT